MFIEIKGLEYIAPLYNLESAGRGEIGTREEVVWRQGSSKHRVRLLVT